MAQDTSGLWKALWGSAGTYMEYGFDIAGEWYGPEQEVKHAVDSGLYEEFGMGSAATAKLSLSLYADSIPRSAKIQRFIRLRNSDQVSEWLPKGVFFISRRSVSDGYWTLEAFDAMRKAEVVWAPDQSLAFPLPMDAATAEFARILEVETDPRNAINHSYTIDYPTNVYTIRQELCFIAAAHGGNWVITDAGKLRLIPILSMPPETSYLIEEHGGAITFGGIRILV